MVRFGRSPTSLGSHLKFVVLPVRKGQGLDLADVRDVAVDPRTVQTDEGPQGAGAPTRIFREKVEKQTRWTEGGRDGWMDGEVCCSAWRSRQKYPEVM